MFGPSFSWEPALAAGRGATYPGPIVAEYTAPDKTSLKGFGALFFSNSDAGKNAAQAYVTTITSPDGTEGSHISDAAIQIQRAAIQAWWGGEGSSLPELEKITHPVLVINGSRVVMVPTPNSFLMSQKLPNAHLIVYPDAGHGSLLQYPVSFVRDVPQFLSDQSTRCGGGYFSWLKALSTRSVACGPAE